MKNSSDPFLRAPPYKRRWYQYSLRLLFVLTTVCAIACSWFAVKRQQAEQQRAAVETLKSWGWVVIYDYELDADGTFMGADPPGPEWLRKIVGADFFACPVIFAAPDGDSVRYEWPVEHRTTDAELRQLASLTPLTQVRSLDLCGSRITDTGLRHLAGMTKLGNLDLGFTKITDAGLAHLGQMTVLKNLSLVSTNITDAGLVRLAGMTQLEHLDIGYTKITDTGLEHLARMTELKNLDLRDTKITDAGLERLAGMTQLQDLTLGGTKITDAGLSCLRRLTQLRRLDLMGTPITDAGLKYLKGLNHLKSLVVIKTNVSETGLEDLQQALPNCLIRVSIGPGYFRSHSKAHRNGR